MPVVSGCLILSYDASNCVCVGSCGCDRSYVFVGKVAVKQQESKKILCSICREPLSFDAHHKVFWCPDCDFDIENLSPVEPRRKKNL